MKERESMWGGAEGKEPAGPLLSVEPHLELDHRTPRQ